MERIVIMHALLGLLCIALFIYGCVRLSRFCFRAADHLDDMARLKEYNERCIRESLGAIAEAVVPPEEEPVDYKERLLRANQKIAEKERLSEAIENELGIT
jgi:hypothetical protein